ncbi:hypothetical protein ABIF64_000614 [Bradyrhizobium japonicum]
MAEEVSTTTGIAAHGACGCPRWRSTASISSLRTTKDLSGTGPARSPSGTSRKNWRKPLRKTGEDPFGKEPSESIGKKVLDAILIGDDTEASAVAHSAIEDFAQELAYVTRRFLKSKPWDKTERIIVGVVSARAGSASWPSRGPTS